jgi:5'-nucleotidase
LCLRKRKTLFKKEKKFKEKEKSASLTDVFAENIRSDEYICLKYLQMTMRNLRIWVLAVLLGLVPFAGCERPDVPGDKTEKPDNSGTGNDQNGGGEQGGDDNKDDGQGGSGDDSGSGDEGNTEPKSKEFVILFTNDFHSQIEPLSKQETYNADRGGIKRIKALVDSVRMAEPAVLLADAGDFVQGTYYFSLLNGEVEMMAMEELGYDVRTIGNHEFDKKMTVLGDMFLLSSSVPVVASNYDFSQTSLATYVRNSIILETGNVKVGFIGLNVRLQNLVDPTACEGVKWQNAINVADEEAKKLRDQGADMVIALSHLGYEKTDEVYYDRGIAKNTRHIDMIIGGHSHTFLNYPEYVTNQEGEKVLITQTGSKGICLGYAKIKLDDNGNPSFTYKLIPVKNHLDKKLDPDFSNMIDTYSAAVTAEMEKVIGTCPEAIRKGSPESPLGNLTADALVWMAQEYYDVKADVALYNTGGIRAEISAGDLTVGDVYAVYPFDNVLSVATLSGKDLKTLFDYVASSGGLPINKEVKMVISGKKVKSVTVNGETIKDNQTYTVATIDYLMNLGRYGLENATDRRDAPEIIRDYFVAYFRQLAAENNGQITASKDGRITNE